MSNRMTLVLAAAIARKLEAGYQDYLDECEQHRREGHRPQHCEHGSSQWTDYDNICGLCEDGWTMSDGVMRRTYALQQAHRRVAKAEQIMEATSTLRSLGVDVTEVTIKPFLDLISA